MKEIRCIIIDMFHCLSSIVEHNNEHCDTRYRENNRKNKNLNNQKRGPRKREKKCLIQQNILVKGLQNTSYLVK